MAMSKRTSSYNSAINVTPMVDVMLVLLIIFMVAAPLLTVSIPVDLPEAKAQVTTTKKTEQLTVTARKASGSCSSRCASASPCRGRASTAWSRCARRCRTPR